MEIREIMNCGGWQRERMVGEGRHMGRGGDDEMRVVGQLA